MPFASNNKKVCNNNSTNNTNNNNPFRTIGTNLSEKPYDPKWNTEKYKNRWEDPNYVKDLRYDMDWSN
jgi:hypothetical protein